jgi:hypothetical protein
MESRDSSKDSDSSDSQNSSNNSDSLDENFIQICTRIKDKYFACVKNKLERVLRSSWEKQREQSKLQEPDYFVMKGDQKDKNSWYIYLCIKESFYLHNKDKITKFNDENQEGAWDVFNIDGKSRQLLTSEKLNNIIRDSIGEWMTKEGFYTMKMSEVVVFVRIKNSDNSKNSKTEEVNEEECSIELTCLESDVPVMMMIKEKIKKLFKKSKNKDDRGMQVESLLLYSYKKSEIFEKLMEQIFCKFNNEEIDDEEGKIIAKIKKYNNKDDSNREYAKIVVKNYQVIFKKEIKKLLKDFVKSFQWKRILVSDLKETIKKNKLHSYFKIHENYWSILFQLHKYHNINEIIKNSCESSDDLLDSKSKHKKSNLKNAKIWIREVKDWFQSFTQIDIFEEDRESQAIYFTTKIMNEDYWNSEQIIKDFLSLLCKVTNLIDGCKSLPGRVFSEPNLKMKHFIVKVIENYKKATPQKSLPIIFIIPDPHNEEERFLMISSINQIENDELKEIMMIKSKSDIELKPIISMVRKQNFCNFGNSLGNLNFTDNEFEQLPKPYFSKDKIVEILKREETAKELSELMVNEVQDLLHLSVVSENWVSYIYFKNSKPINLHAKLYGVIWTLLIEYIKRKKSK